MHAIVFWRILFLVCSPQLWKDVERTVHSTVRCAWWWCVTWGRYNFLCSFSHRQAFLPPDRRPKAEAACLGQADIGIENLLENTPEKLIFNDSTDLKVLLIYFYHQYNTATVYFSEIECINFNSMLSVGQMTEGINTKEESERESKTEKVFLHGNMEGTKKHCPDFACIPWSSMMSIGVHGASSYFQR